METLRIRWAAARLAALAGGAVIVLAACSGGGSGSAPATTSGMSGQPRGTAVTVTETEYALKLSRSSFTPGRYTFTADNAGHVTHALAVSGPGVPTAQTKVLSGGGTAELTVTLRTGSYELWCPVDGHKGLGMDTHIQVGGAASPAPTGSDSGGGSSGGY
jgi:plastocyanin